MLTVPTVCLSVRFLISFQDCCIRIFYNHSLGSCFDKLSTNGLSTTYSRKTVRPELVDGVRHLFAGPSRLL